MRKNEFIRLTIKIIGFAILLGSIHTPISIALSYIISFLFRDWSGNTQIYIAHLIHIAPIFIQGVITILISGYFLFYGRKAYQIIEHRVEYINDNQISFPEAAVITIRAAGVWFFTKAVIILTGFIIMTIGTKLSRIILSNIYDTGRQQTNTTVSFWPNPTLLIITTALTLIHFILAIYLLRSGNFFIRFLTKNKEEFSDNQISHSQLE